MKPDNVSQNAWDRALAIVHEIGESEEHDTLPIALGIMAAAAEEREQCALVMERTLGLNASAIRNRSNTNSREIVIYGVIRCCVVCDVVLYISHRNRGT